MTSGLLHRVFNVAEYYRMHETGILKEDDRVELIGGQIIQMSPISSRHAASVKRLLNALLSLQVQGRAVISVQDPVRLDDRSEPQPDLALLRPRPDFYGSGHPGPEDVHLIVEVSDSSIEYDRDVKLRVFAQSRIPEVWIVDLTADRVEMYRQPVGGEYDSGQPLGRGEFLSPAAFPDTVIAVSDILG